MVDEETMRELDRISRSMRTYVITLIIAVIVYVITTTIQYIVNDRTMRAVDGHYTITYVQDGVKCKYRANEIKFHSGDNVITFRDAISGNEIILNHYVIEVEDE